MTLKLEENRYKYFKENKRGKQKTGQFNTKKNQSIDKIQLKQQIQQKMYLMLYTTSQKHCCPQSQEKKLNLFS